MLSIRTPLSPSSSSALPGPSSALSGPPSAFPGPPSAFSEPPGAYPGLPGAYPEPPSALPEPLSAFPEPPGAFTKSSSALTDSSTALPSPPGAVSPDEAKRRSRLPRLFGVLSGLREGFLDPYSLTFCFSIYLLRNAPLPSFVPPGMSLFSCNPGRCNQLLGAP